VLVLMAVISAVNLLGPRFFFRANLGLTVVKVLVPVVTVCLLAAAVGLGPTGQPVRCAAHQGGGLDAVLPAVVGSGVIFAYVGFQGPLDFAGNVRRRGRGEAYRLRWAVLGTLVGATALYTLFQLGVDNTVRCGQAPHGGPYAPVAAIATALPWRAFRGVLWLDAVLSPLGAGMVFAHALTREVAALGRAHLTHRGLQTARNVALRRGGDVYWAVVAADFFVAVAVLVLTVGDWTMLVAVTGVLALVVYAFPSVTLAVLGDHAVGRSVLRRFLHGALARTSFVLIAVVLYMAGWRQLWQGTAVLAGGSVLLLGLPVLAERWPLLGRFYDAREHVTELPKWRTAPMVWVAGALVLHLGVLLALTLLDAHPVAALAGLHHRRLWFGALVALAAWVAFEFLVRFSRRYVGEVPPSLPAPARSA
jgi:amino acid transporter